MPLLAQGDIVADAEAAASGVVGLYIDLTGCRVCRQGVPATCTGTLIAPDLVLSVSSQGERTGASLCQRSFACPPRARKFAQARHCIDVPASLNGTLDRVVFGSNMFSDSSPTRAIERIVSTADCGVLWVRTSLLAAFTLGLPRIRADGIEAAGNDLVLIKLRGNAPAPWRPIELPLRLLPTLSEQEEAERREEHLERPPPFADATMS